MLHIRRSAARKRLRGESYSVAKTRKKTDEAFQALVERTKTLVEALPYIKAFRGCSIVVKYGGHAMIDLALKRSVIQDIILMDYVGMKPVIVHGGGPEISALMEKMGLKPRFVEGQRVTDRETLEITEMVLAGKLNGEIVNEINQAGARAVGLSGKDAGMIIARKYTPKSKTARGASVADLGFVGEVEHINPEVIDILEQHDFIPVVSPIGVDGAGVTYNINADFVAAEIAIALRAKKLILLTDVRGILTDERDEASLIATLGRGDAERFIGSKRITGGMIPKVRACIRALSGGVEKTHILDGRIPHAILLELLTDKGIGTQIVREKVQS
jgi:acetylglutamate kinase